MAERGETRDLRAGTGGVGSQTWSPSSWMGTGWLQFEHLTVGRICEMRPGTAAGLRSWAIRNVDPAQLGAGERASMLSESRGD